MRAYILAVMALLAASCPAARADFFDKVKNGVENILGIAKAPAPAGSFLAAEAPAPMYSLATDAGSLYGNLKQVYDPATKAGPILCKTALAALFLLNDSASDSSLQVSKAQSLPLSNSTGTLLASYANGTVTLAFNSTDDVYRNLLQNSTVSAQPSFLQNVVPGSSAAQAALQPLEDLLSGNGSTSLAASIANLTDNATPARIVTVGYGAGGGMAQLAAIWAALTWGRAQIRCITFGAPPVMNNRTAFAFQQFVDLPYTWAYNGSLVNTIVRSTDNNNNPTVDGTYNLNDYLQAIINAGAYMQSNGTRVKSTGIGYESASSTATKPTFDGILSAVPGTFDELFGSGTPAPTPADQIANETLIEAVFSPEPAPNSDCPPILCKIRSPMEAACGNYDTPTTSGTILPIAQALPNSKQIGSGMYDTDVVVDWDAANRIAILIWRGSVSQQDWLQDAKLKLVDGSYLFPQPLAQLFPGIEVHYGFTEQFRAVTDKAANSSVNVTAVLASKMNGVMPSKVVCAGHSLGGALASLCAVWAAGQYPSADILSVTLGQPFTGNQHWVDAYRMLVGREYRFVNNMDIVPSLPPVNSYRHVAAGLWGTQSKVFLEARPTISLDDLTWDDHSCYKYLDDATFASNVTILANATADTPLPYNAASS